MLARGKINQRQNQKWQIISKAIFTSLLKTFTGVNFSRDFPVRTDCPWAFEDAWCYASKSLKPTANKSLKKNPNVVKFLGCKAFVHVP